MLNLEIGSRGNRETRSDFLTTLSESPPVSIPKDLADAVEIGDGPISRDNQKQQHEIGFDKQSHRTCVRMSAKDYALLKKRSAAANLSANAWLMAQLENNRPVLHREKETWEAIHFMDEVGREVNIIARDFNSGYGSAEQLQFAVQRLGEVYERLHALRKKGYLYAA